jgi:hypothetical protein
MTFAPANRIRRLQQQHGDRLLTFLTVLLLLLMFVVAPLQAAGLVAFQALGIVIALALIAGALVLSASPTAVVIMSIAFCMNIVVIILRLQKTPSSYDLYLVAGAWLMIALTLVVVVARAVFGPGRVTYHRIVGAVLLYLLIALTFVSLFTFVGLIVPDAFTGIRLEDSPALASTLFYFSFVTLTSTGYGDIVPVHPVARSLCNLETIIGQLYPATLLARLVTLEIGSRSD